MMHDMRDLQCLNAGITPGCYTSPRCPPSSSCRRLPLHSSLLRRRRHCWHSRPPHPFRRLCHRSSSDCGDLVIGVVENQLVVEIVPMDLFVDDCDSFLFISSVLVSRYYHGVLTLNPMYLMFCLYSFFLSTPLSPLFGCVS